MAPALHICGSVPVPCRMNGMPPPGGSIRSQSPDSGGQCQSSVPSTEPSKAHISPSNTSKEPILFSLPQFIF